MEYKIARGARSDPSEALAALEDEVNKNLAAGWSPIGSVTFTFFGNYEASSSHGFVALQAMIKDSSLT